MLNISLGAINTHTKGILSFSAARYAATLERFFATKTVSVVLQCAITFLNSRSRTSILSYFFYIFQVHMDFLTGPILLSYLPTSAYVVPENPMPQNPALTFCHVFIITMCDKRYPVSLFLSSLPIL